MKQIKLLITILVFDLLSNYVLAQGDADRCWVPSDSQIETMQMFKEARKKARQRDEILKEVTISQTQRQDPTFIRAAMECGIFSLYADNSVLKKDKQFSLTSLKQGLLVLGNIDKSLETDWDIALTAIKYNNIAAWHLPLSLKTNKGFILKALRENPHHGWDILSSVSWQSDDRETVLLAVKSYGGILSQVNERFWKDKEIVLAAVKSQKAHYNRRVSQGEERFENNNVLEDVANGRDIPLLNDPDVIKAANTKEVEILPFQESCPNHCSRYK